MADINEQLVGIMLIGNLPVVNLFSRSNVFRNPIVIVAADAKRYYFQM